MIKNIWTHRFIWLLDGILLGILLDRIIMSNPLWAFLIALIILIIGFFLIKRPIFLAERFGVDEATEPVIRTVLLTLVFFVECILLALVIMISV